MLRILEFTCHFLLCSGSYLYKQCGKFSVCPIGYFEGTKTGISLDDANTDKQVRKFSTQSVTAYLVFNICLTSGMYRCS